ncbi:hypothetical protein [Metakosakonia massiliensis]|uniref:Lipoprotein n=1 Tax=Phytobacter massiliensis TaxID=1485952 RepID=A0A6N3G8B4_9ENTR
MKFKTAGVLLISSALLSGCCTMHDGTTQNVDIETNAPAKYKIVNDDGDVVAEGVAPTVVSLKRGDAPYIVTLKRSDTSPEAKGTINDNANGWAWGNILFGGIIGTIIDYSDGAAWDLDKTVNIPTIASNKDTVDPLTAKPAPVQSSIVINNTQNNSKA